MPHCKRFYLEMRVSIIGILSLQEAQMIGKRKAFSIYYLYLQIWMYVALHPKDEDKIVWALDSRGV